MSISGSFNYNINVNTIIKRSLQLLAVVYPGGSVAPEDYELALDELNSMLLAWSTDGLHLWTECQATLYLESGKNSYILGGSSSDRLASTDYRTTLLTAEAISSTAIGVTSSADMTIGDVIGIELDDNTIHWTTIATVPTSTSITITLGLASAASIDNNVYWYTSLVSSITNISGMVLRRSSSQNDLYMEAISRQDYLGTPNKNLISTPFQYYIDRQRDDITLKLYGAATDVSDRIIINHKRAFADLDSPTDLIDFPREWIEPVKYNLAVRLAPYFEQEDKITQGSVIAMVASQSLKRLKGWDKEETSIYIGPDRYDY